MATSYEEFLAKIQPNMLGADGRFVAPGDSTANYMLEGYTPQEVYDTSQGIANQGEWSDDNRLGKPYAQQQADAMLDPAWRTGPNNGGGFLGGLGSAAQGMFDAVKTNPALMAALAGGAAQYFGAPGFTGADSASSALAGNADKAALYGAGGYGDAATAAELGDTAALSMGNVGNLPPDPNAFSFSPQAQVPTNFELPPELGGNVDKAAMFGNTGYGDAYKPSLWSQAKDLVKDVPIKKAAGVLQMLGSAGGQQQATAQASPLSTYVPQGGAQPYDWQKIQNAANRAGVSMAEYVSQNQKYLNAGLYP